MQKRDLKALIFDMDGVLVDSEPLHILAVQILLGRYGIAYSEEENREFLGRKDLLIAATLIQRHSLKISVNDFVDGKEEILSELITTKALPRPGVYKILDAAKELRVPLAIASSATRPTIELIVDTLKIADYFQFRCSGDDVSNGKPAPDIYLLAANKLDIPPDRCLVIEDTQTGITAAKAAGMFCISIPCQQTMHQDHSHADMHLKSLDDLSLSELFCQ